MRLGLGLGLSGPAGESSSPAPWYPTDLGSKLRALWDVENQATLTVATTAITTWAEVLTSYAPTQATTALKPIINPTGINNRPAAVFDATDDYLLGDTLPAGFPSGSTPFEFWALVNQTALVADTTDRRLITYGANAANSGFRVYRAVAGGVNRARIGVGTGSSSTVVTNANADFSGIHIVRAVVDGTNVNIIVDGAAATPLACVPGIGSTALSIGGSQTGANNWGGGVNLMAFTSLLTNDEAAEFYAMLATRGGLS